ncbi:MAG: hypothetical protein A4E53_02271 [Pelotomaculum sp. PtaB.Bin104]|nr:MAG: hypothetical protein A4E53_02271 [Pelotomaculum sp. PtaB.Bin104]
MNDPVRGVDFFRRYSERQLLQYELRSKEKQGRGPMVVLVDVSGSMSGSPLNWAIAMALAMVDTASRQKRQALIAFFDTQIKKVVEFLPGEKNIEKLIEVGTVGAAGGTDYRPAFKLAVDKIRSLQYSRADIVMVTDGLCYLDDGFVKELMDAKKEMDFRVWSVLIGTDPAGELKRYSDEVWAVAQLTEDVAGELFEKAY